MASTDLKDAKDLLEALDIDELPPEEQEALLLDLGDLVFRGSMLRLIERMDLKTKDDFDALLDTNPSEEDVMDFLTARIPDADSAVEETLADIRNDILAVTGA
ncbi:MAG: hypothetical protein QOE22_12 [Candidatus Parcubacteria bacterium]|jgi:hypothetical protein|nr:hypothetical protein [Candidatus Parcubacteria bacterium]